MADPHILLIDNFDSFSFNLVDAFATLGARIDVYRNSLSADELLKIAEKNQSSLIVLSPGPGTPQDAGCCIELIQIATGRFPLFGVCLGHQAMVCAFGGTVGAAAAIVHGKKSRVRHEGHDLFANIPREFDVGRYHSLIAHSLPESLQCIANTGEIVMAIAHRQYPMFGVQFHPESILTTVGQQILANLLSIAVRSKSPGVDGCTR